MNKRIEELKDEIEFLRKRIKEIDLLFGKNLLAMQAACIEYEHGEKEKAMSWIFNTLLGPGEFANDEEKDAQAYFDREFKIIDKELSDVYDWFHERRKREEVKS
ncbi:hypothetical protein [Yersinia frederiksenii]|uniref:hypothetical protein n=1 Tax=Yersinia frederiksenii TaxID=29484 RepID=UPI000BFCD00A|nr:hypothetical protein [Yersinia frederiksenii]ATM86183.1 hypothetical protein CRN74_08860 [Yersinia frederiksenii]